MNPSPEPPHRHPGLAHNMHGTHPPTPAAAVADPSGGQGRGERAFGRGPRVNERNNVLSWPYRLSYVAVPITGLILRITNMLKALPISGLILRIDNMLKALPIKQGRADILVCVALVLVAAATVIFANIKVRWEGIMIKKLGGDPSAGMVVPPMVGSGARGHRRKVQAPPHPG